MFPLFPENQKSIPKILVVKKLPKILDFKFYPSNFTNKNFPVWCNAKFSLFFVLFILLIYLYFISRGWHI